MYILMVRSFFLAVLFAPLCTTAQTPCVAGLAGTYPCSGVDLMARMTAAALGTTALNDCWGWTDPDNGHEYALVGLVNGTAFVDITNPVAPVRIGNLPTHSVSSDWRDIKVYNGYAYIVSEASGHGMQVFNLARLDTVTNPPVTFTENAYVATFSKAHNIVIDEESAMAYVVGANICSGGLAMFSLANPAAPVYVGCFSQDGYTHDAQCVVYRGDDVQYQGKRICFCSNADTFTIVDVDDPTDPMQVSRTTYPGSAYTHQGWLSEDHRFWFMNDELDEQNFGHNTRTRVWNIADLDAPQLLGYYDGATAAIDHNLYTHANLIYESNYRAGLRILDVVDPSTVSLNEIAYFDTYPGSNSASFNGAWSVYPYFTSGNVIISSIEGGLFVVHPKFSSRIPLRVFLQGPFDAGTGLMRDDLRAQGLIPLQEPYTAMGYAHVGGGGGESTTALVLATTGNNAIVDWVVVELRDKNDPTVVIATRSALLQRDGDVVSADATTPVTFPVPMGLYHVAVHHRNHLGVMSAELLPIGPSARAWNMGNGTVPLHGTEPTTNVGGTAVLWAGNALSDGTLRYVGAANDRDPILFAVGGSIPTNTITGYHTEDVDMNGEVKYIGADNDRDPILQNIGGTIPTNTRAEQVP